MYSVGDIEKNQNVIKVNKHKYCRFRSSQDVIYEGLENCRGICESERHNQVLEVPRRCVEGCLPFNPLMNSDQMVCVAEIELGEDGSSLDGFEIGQDVWHRIFVF